MQSLEIIGLIAGACTTFSFVPQILKMWESKSAKDISLGMYAIFATGVVLWIIYGVYLRSLPLVIWNSVTLLFVLVILFFKLHWK
jgi:MtN3 and saliva related transmembrane protein